MASLDDRSNPLFTFKECSSSGALHNKSCVCSKGVEGLYCRQCALLRKKLEEVFQDIQDTSESSNDNINVVIAPQDPFVFNQDPGENSSQSPPHIDHHCCYGFRDSLDDDSPNPPPQPLTYSYEFCGNDAHYGHDCPPQVPFIYNPEPEVKDFHPEDGELEDDVLREKLSKINLLIAKIEALKDNPTPSSDFVTKSPSTSPNSFLEETDTSYNSLPESKTFCFNLEEKSSSN
ncbi:retrotransposon protein, putative, ty1-copia subclass [Tanacetum coccineum]|uniref:Retrotransposon protein, putative, ty1-copia subclass n=1 Tax=Tanacetum coccineum TaxID=301880 RepID=A0ABQ5DE65_9ASTR